MSMTVMLHAVRNDEFTVEAKITSNQYTKDYAVIQMTSIGTDGNENVTIFPSYEQAKEMHKKLSKLMKEIAALEKKTKQE